MQDLLEQNEEIQEALSQTFSSDLDIDEADLDAELDMLGEEFEMGLEDDGMPRSVDWSGGGGGCGWERGGTVRGSDLWSFLEPNGRRVTDPLSPAVAIVVNFNRSSLVPMHLHRRQLPDGRHGSTRRHARHG